MQIGTRKSLKFCMIAVVLTLMLFVISCGGKTDATFNIAGAWSLVRVTPADTATSTPADEQKDLFTFTQLSSDTDVGGTTTPGNGSASETITGSVSGDDVSFTTTVSGGITRNYTGKLSSDGATMSGTWTSTDTLVTPNVTTSGTWSAVVRAVPAFNISGDWTLTEPAGGLGGVEGFSFAQSTNDLTGSTLPVTDPPTTFSGSVGYLDVIFFWKGSDNTLNTLSGRISNGNSISGTWTRTDVNNNTTSVPWSATKNS